MNQALLDNNPHQICGLKDQSDCQDCSIRGDLNCRFSYGKLASFYLIFLLFRIPAVMGVLESGYGKFLYGWLAMAAVFFGFWEIRILCSHCPYYAEKGLTLKCPANYGCPKFFKYRPGPISRGEKVQLVIGFIIMAGYPFVFLVLASQYLYLAATTLGLVVFFGALLKFKCSRCINFSCIFNRVPKSAIEAFLDRNPIMKQAWR